jgi:hypothetical protein
MQDLGFQRSRAYIDQVKNSEFFKKDSVPFTLKTLILIWCVFSDILATLSLKVRMAMY